MIIFALDDRADAAIQIVQLQHKKLAMTEAALSTDPDAALGKLTVEDVSSDIPALTSISDDFVSLASFSRCKGSA